jgi:hypothetical protein
MAIDPDIERQIKEHARQRGYHQPMEYLRDLLQRDAAEGEEALENLLLERLNDPRPGTDFTPEFQEQFRERIHRRRQSAEARP